MVAVYGSSRPARARRLLIHQLKRANAVSQDRAVPLEVNGRAEERMLARLIRREIVRPGPRGGYWLDKERYADFCRQQIIFVIGALLVTAGIMACVLLYAPKEGGRAHRTHAEMFLP
jgi:hypothetical protein